jgi:hypothetical protein
MVLSMRRRDPKRELIRSAAGSICLGPRQPKSRARVTGNLAFGFGRNFPTARRRIEARRPPVVIGEPKPEPAALFRYPPCRTLR